MSSSIPNPIPDGATVEQLRRIASYWMIEAHTEHHRWIMAMDECDILRKKVDWLMKADKLIVWDGEQWKVRQEQLPEGRR